MLLPNGVDYIAALYGALALGAIAVPLNPLLRGAEVAGRLDDSGARLLVTSAAEPVGAGLAVPLVEPAEADGAEPWGAIAERAAGEPAVLLYTSGTTGRPKGAELTHGGLRATASFLAGSVLALRAGDAVLGAAPLTHVFGLAGVLNPALATGACIVLVPRFDAAAALELMRRDGVEVFLGVPSMCIALLRAADAGGPVPRLRVAHVGGAPLAPETLHDFASRFGCAVLEGYGMTETSGGAVSHVSGQAVRPGSVGTAGPGVAIRIVTAAGGEATAGEPGEVLLRTPGLMRGYWGNPEATREAFADGGWFRTGDVGYLDADGYLFLIDRTKDVILRGGYSVYPREVEDVLFEHPAVSEAAVVGVPDDLLGEEVVALIVPRAGQACDPGEIRAFARERVAAYKYPRLVAVVDALPRTPSGKVLKREIDREALRRALDADPRPAPPG